MNGLTDFTYYRGRVALYAILKAMGVGPGDEVILQAFTCVAVPEAILAAGATPVYADIGELSTNVDPASVADRISPRTRAIIAQHTFGIPCALDKILEIAGLHDIPVIEDCAHSLFSSYRGQPTGTFGAAAFYSFEWGKPIIAGIGGAAKVNCSTLEQRLAEAYPAYSPPTGSSLKARLQYGLFGLLYHPRTYWHVRRAFHALSAIGLATGNYNAIGSDAVPDEFSWRMSPYHTDRLRTELADSAANVSARRRIADTYRENINAAALTHFAPPASSDTVYTRYPLFAGDKVALLSTARRNNIEVAPWYLTPVHPLDDKDLAAVSYTPGSCPRAETLSRHLVSLPVNSKVTDRSIAKTVTFLNGF